MKESSDTEYAQSAQLLADCYKAVSFMAIGKEFTARDICERLDREVSSNAVSHKLRRIRGLEYVRTRGGRSYYKKVAEVWY